MKNRARRRCANVCVWRNRIGRRFGGRKTTPIR